MDVLIQLFKWIRIDCYFIVYSLEFDLIIEIRNTLEFHISALLSDCQLSNIYGLLTFFFKCFSIAFLANNGDSDLHKITQKMN